MENMCSSQTPPLIPEDHKDTSLNVGTHNVAIDVKVDANEFALREHKSTDQTPLPWRTWEQGRGGESPTLDRLEGENQEAAYIHMPCRCSMQGSDATLPCLYPRPSPGGRYSGPLSAVSAA